MSNYKPAQNSAVVTHADTMLIQFHITNTASARCRYIPFHKKEILAHPWRWLIALEEILYTLSHDHSGILTLTYTPLRMSIHTLHKHTKVYECACVHTHTLTHTIFRICCWFQACPSISILYFSVSSWKTLVAQKKISPDSLFSPFFLPPLLSLPSCPFFNVSFLINPK